MNVLFSYNSDASSNRVLFHLEHNVMCGNFQILLVSAVKICKHCLEAAFASGRLRLQTRPYRWFAFYGPVWLSPLKIPGLQLPNENSWCRYRACVFVDVRLRSCTSRLYRSPSLSSQPSSSPSATRWLLASFGVSRRQSWELQALDPTTDVIADSPRHPLLRGVRTICGFLHENAPNRRLFRVNQRFSHNWSVETL